MSERQTLTGEQDAVVSVEPQEAQSIDWDVAHKILQELALGDKGLEVTSDIADFANLIRSNIKDFQKYRAYYVLSPNTLPSKSLEFNEEDLPEEYAVMPFLRMMQEKYGSHD